MSAETDLRALLAGYAGLTALVGTRIAQNEMLQDVARPYLVWTVQHTPEYGLDNTLHGDACVFAVECWGDTSLAADAAADQVVAALLSQGRVVTARASAYEPDMGLHATVVTAEWWVV